jgi:hypothetical protein
MNDEVPSQDAERPRESPGSSISPQSWGDIRREAELGRWLNEAQTQPTPTRHTFGSFLTFAMVLPYILAMLGVLAMGLFLAWAIRTFW